MGHAPRVRAPLARCFDDVFSAGARLRKHPAWLRRGDADGHGEGAGECGWGPAAPLVLNFALLANGDEDASVSAGDPSRVAPREMVLDMPIPEAPVDSELGGLFLQTMAQLVAQGASAQRAFDKMLWYMYMSGVKEDANVRPEVIHDGEGPTCVIRDHDLTFYTV